MYSISLYFLYFSVTCGTQPQHFVESVVFLQLEIDNMEDTISYHEFREYNLIICMLCKEKGIGDRSSVASPLITSYCLLYCSLVPRFSLYFDAKHSIPRLFLMTGQIGLEGKVNRMKILSF